MNLLHVISALDQRQGGPTRAVLDLSAASQAYGIHNEVITVGDVHVQDNPLEHGLIHAIPIGIRNPYAYAPQLSRWLRLNIQRFDCVVLHGMWLYPIRAAARACWKSGVPYVIFPHGMLEPWSIREQGKWKHVKKVAYWNLFEKKIFEKARCSLFATEREMQQAKNIFRFRWPAKVVVPYGVGQPNASDPDTTLPVRELEGLKFVLFLGRLHPCKNIPLLIRAWATADVNTEWKLVIVGPASGEYRRQLENLAEKLSVRKQCIFLDFVAGGTKEWLFRNARWFALPSQHENLGIAMLEALSYGCPVVVSDQVYATDCLEPYGRILPLNEEAWTDFLRTRLLDEDFRRQVIASDAKAIDRYRMDRVAGKWADFLDSQFNIDTPDDTKNISDKITRS